MKNEKNQDNPKLLDAQNIHTMEWHLTPQAGGATAQAD